MPEVQTFQPIPVYQRFPHTVIVRRPKTDSDEFDIIVPALKCKIYRGKRVLSDLGFGHAVTGPYKMFCKWEDAHGPTELTDVREGDHVVRETDFFRDDGRRREQHFTIKEIGNPGELNYNAEFVLERGHPFNA